MLTNAILGRKIGMTQLILENGDVVPVTAIEAGPCVVTQKKTVEVDDYAAVQVAFFDKKNKHTTKPLQGHFAKAGTTPKRYLKEFIFANKDLNVGDILDLSQFSPGDFVDVTGISKGKGYAGTIKRYNNRRGPMSHGSGYHRWAGSMGAHSDPSRVYKGKKMPGHMGTEKITIQNISVVKIDVDRNILLLKGAVPGPKKGLLIIKNAVKKSKKSA
jgi:large subunit ribosomal protein L3